MALSAGDAYVAILPDAKAFGQKLLGQVAPQLQKAASSLSAEISSKISAGTTAAAAAFTVLGAAAVKGAAAAVDATVDLATEVRQLSAVTGQSAEDASKLVFTANELGVGFEALSRSATIFDKNLVHNTGSFAKWGISLQDASGRQKGFDELLGEAADRYREVGGGIRGAALAQDLFGRGGKALIPILRAGREGLKEYGDEAKRLGVVLSSQDVQAAFAFQIAQRKLGEAIKGVEVRIGTGLIPQLTKVVNLETKAIEVTERLAGGLGAFERKVAAGLPGLGSFGQALQIFAPALDAWDQRNKIVAQSQADLVSQLVAQGTPAIDDFQAAVNRLDAQGRLPYPKTFFQDAINQARQTADAVTGSVDQAETKLKEFPIVTEVTASSFADALGMTQAELKDWESQIADSVNFAEAKLQDLAGQAHVSAAGIVKAFDRQLVAQHNYGKNLQELVDKGYPADFLKQLVDLGTGGAATIAALAHANAAQTKKIIADWIKTQNQADRTTARIDDLYAAANRAAGTYTLTFDINTRGKLPGGGDVKFASGGVITEPVVGFGTETGRRYTLGESGPEEVRPLDRSSTGVGAPPSPSAPPTAELEDALERAMSRALWKMLGSGGSREITLRARGGDLIAVLDHAELMRR